MRTVAELIAAVQNDNLYQPKSFLHNDGIKDLRVVRFQEIVNHLEADEDVGFCLPYNMDCCVAFTNKRIIDASKMNDFFQANQISTYSYESINGVEGFVNYLTIKITGERDKMYAPLRGREQVAVAVKKINDVISGYKKLQSQSAQTVVNNISPADELKKFKELLDAGIITQEEFDAKKKQLLGL